MTGTRTQSEETLEPDLPIVDAHHHLWDRPGARYLLEEYLADAAGHNILATVYVQCRSMYRTTGPEEFRVIGETEFANGIAAQAESGLYGPTRVCAGIVTHANMMLGDNVEPILQEHMKVGGNRFRGIRHLLAWDADSSLLVPGYDLFQGMLAEPEFRKGLVCLARHDLSFEAFLFHPQLPELTDVARALPDLKIILNHVGTPVRIGSYLGKDDEVFEQWTRSITELADCPNVYIKLGGLGMHWLGFPFDASDELGSAEIAEAWKPFIEHCIEAFGVERCMFESNFPPDGHATDFHTLWNALKRIASGASQSEKDQLFRKTAVDAYRLQLPT